MDNEGLDDVFAGKVVNAISLNTSDSAMLIEFTDGSTLTILAAGVVLNWIVYKYKFGLSDEKEPR